MTAEPGRLLSTSADLTDTGVVLTLGHVLTGVGAEHDPPIRVDDVHLIRHTFKPGDHHGLRGPEDLTEEPVREYTRAQSVSTTKFPADPPRYWVVLIADGKRRSRLFCVYENHGEVVAERDERYRYFDLRRSAFLAPLVDRLVIEWTSPRNWHRRATSAANLPVLDPPRVEGNVRAVTSARPTAGGLLPSAGEQCPRFRADTACASY